MKRNLEILKGINSRIMDLEQNEVNEVLKLANTYNGKPEMAAEKIAAYLSETLPVKVESDLILDIII